MSRHKLQLDLLRTFLAYILCIAGNTSLFAHQDASSVGNIDQQSKLIIDKADSLSTHDSISKENRLETKSKDSVSNSILKNNLKNLIISKLTNEQANENIEKNGVKELAHLNGYADYQGMTIRNINIQQLEIFGQTCSDTSQLPSNWFEKLGNGLHIHTQQYILKNQMLIKSGDLFDTYLLAENERLLRELPYIDDAVTYVSEVGDGSVDILIITKDVFPLGFGLELLDVVYGRANLYDKNLLGLGHELNYNLTWNYNRNPFYGHKIQYRIQNIGSSFFSLDASYENQWNIEAFRINIERDFYSQNTKFAGGIRFDKIYSLKNIILKDTTLENIKVDYNFHDFWLGRAIMLRRSSMTRSRTNIAITARAMRYEFFRRPDVEETFLYEFHERTTCLMSLGISRQGYYKSTFIYGYGRTEDIPFGSAFSLTGGIDFDEFYSRPYIGINYSHGSHVNKVGYIRKQVAFGGFINQEFEQGLLVVQVNYFSDLLNKHGRYKYRIFTDLEYKNGFNRFEDEYLEFNKRDGIRGLNSTDLRGNQRFNINFEPVCYAPHALLGFKFVYYIFIDAGIISNTSSILVNNNVYTGFGAGLRIRNDNLVFDAIHLRLAFYPSLPYEADPEYILLTSSSNRKFANFTVPKPEVLKYQTRL